MSDSCDNIDINSSLYEILKNCAAFQSYETLPVVDFNDDCFTAYYSSSIYIGSSSKMLSSNQYSVSGNVSDCSYTSEDSFGGNIFLEETGRISLAYENLNTIPRKIAEKFAIQTKFLDLSYNNFQDLSFLAVFEDLHTLILDRNTKLDVNTLPFLQNLKIIWINNCDIKNVVDWINCIKLQCPCLEYLSIMGNPGINEVLNTFNNIFNNNASDYREYILQMLPNLRYLNDVPRKTVLKVLQYPDNQLKPLSNSSSTSPESGSSSHGQYCNGNASRQNSFSLSFKELFLLKRRKISYPSSSTN